MPAPDPPDDVLAALAERVVAVVGDYCSVETDSATVKAVRAELRAALGALVREAWTCECQHVEVVHLPHGCEATVVREYDEYAVCGCAQYVPRYCRRVFTIEAPTREEGT